MYQLTNIRFLVACVLGTLFVSAAPAMGPETSANTVAKPAFYAFCFDTHDAQKRNLEQQAKMLREIGFDGAGHVGIENLSERIQTLNAQKLTLFVAGVRVDLRKGASAPIAELKSVASAVKGSKLLLYVVLTGIAPADPSGTDKAVSIMREMSDAVRSSNIRLGIYPHTGDWVARADHAVRVADKVDRANVGVIFNVCHWLRNEELESLEAVLEAAAPRLFGVTINGADLAGKQDDNWDRLIMPLGEGDFDNLKVLATLNRLGYRGPIGLMCYGIGGDAAEHLQRSMKVWKKLQIGNAE